MNEKKIAIMDEEKFIKYLEFAHQHYVDLEELMIEKGREDWAQEHNGRIKFIDLLLLKIKKGIFR